MKQYLMGSFLAKGFFHDDIIIKHLPELNTWLRVKVLEEEVLKAISKDFDTPCNFLYDQVFPSC